MTKNSPNEWMDGICYHKQLYLPTSSDILLDWNQFKMKTKQKLNSFSIVDYFRIIWSDFCMIFVQESFICICSLRVSQKISMYSNADIRQIYLKPFTKLLRTEQNTNTLKNK